MQFKDNKGRDWDVELNIGTTMRLKAEGVKFHELAENKCAKYFALEHDDEALSVILWGIVRPQADAAKITKDDFFSALGGESLNAALEVFQAAYTDFTRAPAIRSALKKSIASSKRLQEKTSRSITERMERYEQIAEEELAKEIAKMTDEKMRETIEAAKNSQPKSVKESSCASPVS